MNQVDRYKKMIMAKLKLLQAQAEYKEAKRDLEETMTVSELKGDQFHYDNTDAGKAFTDLVSVNKIKLESADHVGSQVEYKDIVISLHESKNGIGAKAIYNLMEEA